MKNPLKTYLMKMRIYTSEEPVAQYWRIRIVDFAMLCVLVIIMKKVLVTLNSANTLPTSILVVLALVCFASMIVIGILIELDLRNKHKKAKGK